MSIDLDAARKAATEFLRLQEPPNLELCPLARTTNLPTLVLALADEVERLRLKVASLEKEVAALREGR